MRRLLRLVFIELPRGLKALWHAFTKEDWNEDGERDDWTRDRKDRP